VKSPTELTALYRRRGRKVTPQRQAVFRVLHGNTEHPTAEAVHARVSSEMPTISLRTVYQVLYDLADMGELDRLDLGTGSSRFDPNLDPHHHLVCEGCGTVQDVEVDFTDVRLPEPLGAGFRVSSTEIIFRGRCPSCRAVTGDAPCEPDPPTKQRKSQHG
jgi:Fe2+ or Zn2+ uptake regulation protein